VRNLIVGLARPLLRLLGSDERGGVAVLVAVLISGGVLLGIGALVIDVGQIYQNRAELQSGAEAGALAVARACAAGACPAGASQYTLATQYADANASALTGHLAQVSLVCGRDANAVLTACTTGTTTSSSDLTDCPPSPSSGNYVDVHSATQTPSGTVLPPVFARSLLGAGGYSGTTVAACAQVEWGTAEQSNSLAFTISLCAWQGLVGADTDASSDTGNGIDADGDSDDNGAFNTPIAVYIKGKAKPCAGPGGQNVPGGFGWLASTPGTCTATIDLTTNTTYTDPGNNVTAACKAAVAADVAAFVAGNPVTVFVPVFDSTSGTGSNAAYHVTGLAGFVIMGNHKLPGMADGGTWNACLTSDPSASNQPCIEGYFKPGLDPVGSIGSGNNFGANTVQITG
jgi:Flp pilus assembly protein TadG